MKCINCGNELNEKAKFCSKCGSKVEEQQKEILEEVVVKEQEEMKKCVHCGNELNEKAKFCGKCGSSVEEQKAIHEETVAEEQPRIQEEKQNVFNMEKRKMIGRMTYKVTRTEVINTGEGLDIKQHIHKFFGRDKKSNLLLKYSEIGSAEVKTKMDFWDTLYAVIFGIIYLFELSNIVLLLFVALFLYTGYGKSINLKMKNGLSFEIPVDYATEDVVKFQKLIELKR